MEVGLRTVVLIVGVSLAAGALVQKQWDNKEIDKAKSEQKVLTETHIITVVKEIKKPDGTTETDTTTTDNSIKREIEKNISEHSAPVKGPTWLISAGTSLDIDRVQAYQVQVQRQILGPVFLGIYGSTRKEAGVSVGVLF